MKRLPDRRQAVKSKVVSIVIGIFALLLVGGAGPTVSAAIGALAPAHNVQADLFRPGDVIFTAFDRVVTVNPSRNRTDFILTAIVIQTDAFPRALLGIDYDSASGDVYVVDSGGATADNFVFAGRVLRISDADGSASDVGVCADFTRPDSANCFEDAFDLAVMPDGRIAVTNPIRRDSDPANNNDGEVWIVDPLLGTRILLAKANLLWDPHGITVDPSGTIYVADTRSNGGAVISIDPNTGAQALVAMGGDLLFASPSGIDWDATTGTLVVAAQGSGVIRVDPALPDGSNQTLIAALRAPQIFPASVAVAPDGTIVNADFGAFRHNGGIFQINLAMPRPIPIFINLSRNEVCCVFNVDIVQ